MTKLAHVPQLALFTDEPPAKTAVCRRHSLDDRSWVDHIHGWYPEGDRLFSLLSTITGWEQRSRWMFTKMVSEPRLTAEFKVLEQAPVIEVHRLAARLSADYGVPYDSAWMNLYRDGNDSTSWHADRPAHRAATAIVPVLSLGETRRFQIRPKAGGRSVTFTVSEGDLIVMGGRCQRDWLHAVPKETSPRGPRISVNFGSSLQTG